MAGTALPTANIAPAQGAASGKRRLVELAGYYSLSAVGPIAVSGAHFAASLIFLHRLAPVEFGLFSFLLVVVPFCLSLSSGLLGAPLLSAIGKSETVAEVKRATFREVNRLFCVAAGIATALLMEISHAGLLPSLLLGAYGAVMAFRWFARYNAYNANQPYRAAASDLVYCFCLLSGLVALVAAGHLSLHKTSMVLLTSALLGVLPFGWHFLRDQLRASVPGSLKNYAPIWRDITRWSLMGVTFSEVTANAHAYLVTFHSGPKAFALLAVGGLLMRPISLVLSALPDRERPIIAGFLAAGNVPGALRSIKAFRTVAGAIWLATITLSAVILIWYPGIIIREGFDAHAVTIVVAIWALIVAVRALRAPEAAFLQAAGEFNPLARTGMAGSSVSLIGTLVLLLLFGPVASLCGILAGEMAMTFSVTLLMRSWRRAHA